MKSNLVALTTSFALTPLALLAQGTQPPPKPSTPMSTSMPLARSRYLRESRLGESACWRRSRRRAHRKGRPCRKRASLGSHTVNVRCDGKTRYTTYADHKGNFSIVFAEAGGSETIQAGDKPAAIQFVGCFVAAGLAGFDSAPVPIAGRKVVDSADLGTITLRREAHTEGAALSATTAAAPKDALKVFEKARGEWLDNKPDRVQRDLQKAVELDPQFAEAWFQLGKIQAAANSPEALNSFSKAVAADPKFSLPYEHMAPLTAQAGSWQDLVEFTNRALELVPPAT